jgi:hypothetical protein
MTRYLTPLALTVLLAATPLAAEQGRQTQEGRSRRGAGAEASPRGGRSQGGRSATAQATPRRERRRGAAQSDGDRSQAARRWRQRRPTDRVAGQGRDGSVRRNGRRPGGRVYATRGRNVVRGRSPRYYPYGAGALGLGYLYYDPYAWYPYDPYGGYPYGYTTGGYQYGLGSLRLDVDGPRDAHVLVDGYYAGVLDDFDGRFQALQLEAGEYSIEIVKPGYETLTFDTWVQAGRKITFRENLRRLE